jgi:hypothetical protein
MVRGKWAAGIPPRFFEWIIKGQLAISERPGGYARNHRKVRRHEEILWLRNQGFTRVVSLLPSPHNLHAYDEHVNIRSWLAAGERVLIHQEELGDRLMGVVAAYLRWSGLIPSSPKTITVVEQILGRQMGPEGRQLVALAPTLRGHAADRLGR